MWYFLIVSGAILIIGLTTGVSRSFQQIYEYTLPAFWGDTKKKSKLKTVLILLLKTGLCSMSTYWLFPGGMRESVINPINLMIVGIWVVLALGHMVIVWQIQQFRRMPGPLAEIAGGGILGVICAIILLFLIPLGYLGGGAEEFVLRLGLGVLIGCLFAGLWEVMHLLTFCLHWMVFALLSRLLIFLRFRTIICRHCLRYTSRLHVRYKDGIRYCEHCQHEVEYTHNPGKVIMIFGDFPLKTEDRIFLLINPTFGNPDLKTKNGLFFRSKFDIGQREQPIDVSEVYIETKTAEPRQLECFITFIVNYPPKHGIQSVRIMYRGALSDLGENLKNGLQNNFPSLEELPPGFSVVQKSAIP